jgi:hypothetical protein
MLGLSLDKNYLEFGFQNISVIMLGIFWDLRNSWMSGGRMMKEVDFN